MNHNELAIQRLVHVQLDHTNAESHGRCKRSCSVFQGVCGSAVAEKRDKIVPDVSKEPNYLACSSATKSELVILIRKGDSIFAQIDIDSHEFDAFDAQMIAEVRKVAEWLARAYADRRGNP